MRLEYRQQPDTYHRTTLELLFTYFKELSVHKVPVILIDLEMVVYKVSPTEVLHKFLVMRRLQLESSYVADEF